MAFIDSSGDIILDSTITDTGRFRLAKGDGSFKIVKFALGDDEINYRNFNKNHSSGSAYYDLDILQTPILEAFTNNTATMQSKLISIPRTNLLYLPIIKLNELPTDSSRHSSGAFILAVDEETEDALIQSANGANNRGIMKGARAGDGGGSIIRLDQGLDTTEISPSFVIDADLIETQYIIEIDNRLASVVDNNGSQARISFIDDDNIASYYLSLGTDAAYVSENTVRDESSGTETIRGPRGTILKFKLRSSIELNTSDFLFDQLGSTATINSTSVKYIDSMTRITGATTGYRVDIPIRFAKKI